MTQATHTPGPWTWDYYASGHALIGAPSTHSSVRRQVFLQHGTPDGDLIAAAPDMLAELEFIRDEYCNGGMLDGTEAERGILAVIAKARGEG